MAYATEVFEDVSANSWYYEDVKYSQDKGWIYGYPDGLFHPDDVLSKAQAIAMVSSALGYLKTKDSSPWYKEYVEFAFSEEFIDDGEQMELPISRLDVSHILYKAYNIAFFTDDWQYSTPFTDIDDNMVSALNKAGVINGVGNNIFNGEELVTRAQLCAMLTRLDKLMTPLNKDTYNSLLLDVYDFSSTDIYHSNYKDIAISNVNKVYIPINLPTYKEDELNKIMDKYSESYLNMTSTFPEFFSIFKSLNIRYTTQGDYFIGIELVLNQEDTWTLEEAFSERELLFSESKKTISYLENHGLINSSMTEKEKAYQIAKYVVENSRYDTDVSIESSYGSRFYKDGLLTCMGYSSLFNALCHYTGIESYAIRGTSDNEGHIWNICNLDGKWLMIDLTFMDPIYYVDGERKDIIQDKYFGITESQLLRLDNKRIIDWTNFNWLNIKI